MPPRREGGAHRRPGEGHGLLTVAVVQRGAARRDLLANCISLEIALVPQGKTPCRRISPLSSSFAAPLEQNHNTVHIAGLRARHRCSPGRALVPISPDLGSLPMPLSLRRLVAAVS
jgi:hypothetical protein